MGQRPELQALLVGLLESKDVYFQPPSSIQMVHPCIVYKLDTIRTRFADNKPYNLDDRYQITVIDKNPDSVIPKKVAELPKCSFDRSFVANNLNHFVFNIFF